MALHRGVSMEDLFGESDTDSDATVDLSDVNNPNDTRTGSPDPGPSLPKKPRLSSSVKSEAGSSKASSVDNGTTVKSVSAVIEDAQPLSFLLTKVHGIEAQYNASLAVHIKDLLSPSLGNLQRSAQFNYCIDIPWLVSQYPAQFRLRPLLIVHGAQRGEKAALDVEASQFENVKLCQARLDIAYGTHHTKMMFLLYDNGLRVIIHTANLIDGDWHQKTQGVWVSPVFPRMSPPGGASLGESTTNFKQDLVQYIIAYKQHQLDEWVQIIKQHDMSSAKVHLIASVPGRHSGDKKMYFGHLKLRKVLLRYGPRAAAVTGWPVIGQFSSVGSLGGDADSWLCSEWLKSLSTTRDSAGNKTQLQLVFPSKENVRCSLEGYMAGGSIPYSIHTARKQPYFNTFLHQWKSSCRGRSRASPHIKTYMRVSPAADQLAWFLVTSSNLSKAAWGAIEKNDSQLMIRSYELGVLFLPEHFSESSSFAVAGNSVEMKSSKLQLKFPVPYDLPLTPYTKEDRPWVWDIAYTDKPDSHGNQWSPSP